MYPTSFMYQFKLLLKRAIAIEYRIPQILATRLLGTIILALLIGTVFVATNNNQQGSRTKGGLFFIMLNYWTLGGLPTIIGYFADRPLLNMQRRYHYYSTLPYLITLILAELPFAFLEVTVYGTITYWMTGLNTSNYGAHFFIFIPILFSTYITFKAFCRLVAALVNSSVGATGLAPFGLVIWIIFAGYILPMDYIPDWWIWLHYLSPSKYAFGALMINEFYNQDLYCSSNETVPPAGTPGFTQGICAFPTGKAFIDRNYNLQTQGWIIPIYVACIWVLWFIFNAVAYLSLRYLHHTDDSSKRAYAAVEQNQPNVKKVNHKLLRPFVHRNKKPNMSTSSPSAPGLHQRRGSTPYIDRRSNLQTQQSSDALEQMERGETHSFYESATDSRTQGSFSVIRPSASSDTGDFHVNVANDTTDELDKGWTAEEQQRKEIGTSTCGGRNPVTATSSNSYLSPGAIMTWQNLDLTRKNLGHPLLQDINGYVRPGMILAVLGATGAGKSTLINLLAGRTGGKISGKLHINGKEGMVPANMRRSIGYVGLREMHSPLQTVREAVEFSANTRLAHTSHKQKQKLVDTVLEMLDLTSLSNALIGTGENNGLLPFQRKRLAIALELACDPLVLFLDDPVIQLDPLGATRVMIALKKAASQGKSIICALTQPSRTVLGMCTHALILQSGLQTYFGPVSDSPHDGDFGPLRRYYKQIGNPCPANRNMAEFIMTVDKAHPKKTERKKLLRKQQKTGAGRAALMSSEQKAAARHVADIEGQDLDEAWAQSDECKQLHVKIAGFQVEQQQKATTSSKKKKKKKNKNKQAKETETETEKQNNALSRGRVAMQRITGGLYAAGRMKQLYYLIKRRTLSYWRNPGGFRARFLRSVGFGLMLGTLFLQLSLNQHDAGFRAALSFLILLFAVLNVLPIVNVVLGERPILYREQAACMYSKVVYAVSIVLAELPWSLGAVTIFAIPAYFLAGFQYDAERFFIFYGILILFTITMMTLAQALAVLSPNPAVGNIAVLIMISAGIIFAGFTKPHNTLPPYWIWGYYINPFAYALEAIATNELHGLSLWCTESELVPVPMANGTVARLCAFRTGDALVQARFHLSYDHVGRDAGILAGLMGFFCLVILLGVKFLHWKK
eukprot:TRINITY_DN1603_c2_g1_i3.p1 TRINITY_DN1603_c2_g1~~TRINITY_DN1603_c2_g1_i3.p1  ORF type:complete len:1132 (+),score=105.15 TRINITY_DN1603_c2_g1_i3:182-3577(+)